MLTILVYLTNLPCLTNLNLQPLRSDPLIHFFYDVLFTASYFYALLSRFMKQMQERGIFQCRVEIAVENPTNYVTYDKLFVGLLAKKRAKSVLEKGDISRTDVNTFYDACLQFLKAVFYVIKNFPLDIDVHKHSRFLNILQQKCSFESVLCFVERFQHYI